MPAGYTFNPNGTAIYLTIATLFIAQAMNIDLSLSEQMVIFGVLMLTSKGSAGVVAKWEGEFDYARWREVTGDKRSLRRHAVVKSPA